MNPRNFLDRLVNCFAAKPAPRNRWRAAVVLEALEIRLNLAAVLIIETVDAYWLYDDADALLKAASEGQAASSSLSDPNADFTPQELQVIDGLVAELIADEGYSDSDILAITYVDDTTSDELIAEGFFDDGFFDNGSFADGVFEEGNVAETLADFAEATDLFENTDALLDLGDVSSNLAGAAGTDTISLGNGDIPLNANVQLGDRLTALVSNSVLPAIEATSGASLVGQLASRIRNAETPARHKAISSGPANREVVSQPRTVLPPSLVTKAEAAVLSVVPPLASASASILPFAKFSAVGLTSAGIASGLEYTTSYFLSPRSSSSTDDATDLETDEAGQVSYSQIAAACGAGGLAVACWLNYTREIESASLVSQAHRRGRRTRQTPR